MDQARETFSEWETLIEERSGEDSSKLNEIVSAREKYQGQLDDAIFVYENFPDNTSEILRELGEADGFRENNLNPLIDQFYQDELESLQRKAASVKRITNLMILGGAIFGGISIIIALISAFVISRGITRSTSHLSEAADSISRGDLDVPIEVNTGDEMEDLAESIERMRTSLKAAIERLRR
jgi:HAMP domain-containing protein